MMKTIYTILVDETRRLDENTMTTLYGTAYSTLDAAVKDMEFIYSQLKKARGYWEVQIVKPEGSEGEMTVSAESKEFSKTEFSIVQLYLD